MIGRLFRFLSSLPPRGVVGWHRSVRIARPRYISNPGHIEFGRNVVVRQDLAISPITRHGTRRYDPRVRIAGGVYIGRYCFIGCIDRIDIGKDCVISDYVYLTDVTHGMMPGNGPILDQPLESSGPIILGDNCFLGYGVRVMPGVTLGQNCVVATSAVVTTSYPAYTMLAGIPARPIKTFDFASNRWQPVIGRIGGDQ